MSIIGIRGIPPKLSLMQFIRKLAHVLNGQFEAFSATHKTKSKTFYLKLSPNLETHSTIEIINKTRFPFQLQAFLPKNVINIQMPQKTKKIPNTLRKALKIPLNFTPAQVLSITHEQIIMEMLSKFTKLYELSCSTYHFLLKTLYQTVYEKLEKVQSQGEFDSCYGLSKCYRDHYPHSSDIQLIKDIYMNYQLQMGLPETELNEKEFCEYVVECPDESASCTNLMNLSHEYSCKIISKIMDHINSYDFDKNRHPSAAIQVRQHIKKLSPLMPQIVKSIMKNQFNISDNETFELVRVYGEPFLPNKKIMNPFLRKFSYKSAERSERIYNLITVKIPTSNYFKILKSDGTNIIGSKLTIRPLNTKKHIATFREIKIMISQEKNVNDQKTVREEEEHN